MRDEHKSKAELIAELHALRERLAARGQGTHASDPYTHILENMRAMICEIDGEGRITYVSSTLPDLLGYSPEEIIGQQGFQWIHEEDLVKLQDSFQTAITSGQVARYLYRARHKSGHWVWLEGTGSVYRTAGGEPRVVAFSRDITDVRRADEARRDSEDRFQAMVDNASDFLAELDINGRFLFASSNCRRLFGRSPEFFIGKSLADMADIGMVHPEDQESMRTGYRTRVIATGGGEHQVRFRSADDTWRWFENTATTYQRSDGELRVVVICRDINAQRTAQLELVESEKRYRYVTEASGNLISELDPEGRMAYVSPSLVDILGYRPEEMVGTTPFALVHPDDVESLVETFLEAVASESSVTSNAFRARHRDGTYHWLEGRGLPYRSIDGELRLLGVHWDVTEKREAERERQELQERMQQAQKLESLGVMAGGIAHDFNNLLTPILGGTTLALMELPPESPARARIQMIQKAAHRAAALTNQMLAYTGNESLQFEVLDLSRLVEEMGQLLASAVSKKAELLYELAPDLPSVEADAAQLSQVAMNLITNAAESLGDHAGRIAIRTGVVEADRALLEQTLPGENLPEGTYVYFEVVDTGTGMDSETRTRIFDPFFTTKFTGRGLGLAAVLGIVRSHGGAIELDSVPGLGTRFRVLLPRSARRYSHPKTEETDITSWQGTGTVLVVDDDQGVLEFSTETLESAGLTVLCAHNGREAVRLFAEHADSIRLVLLDRTMPASSGEEAFERIRELRPDVPVVMVSGYATASLNSQLADLGLSGFLHKPFLPTALLAKVRELLER